MLPLTFTCFITVLLIQTQAEPTCYDDLKAIFKIPPKRNYDQLEILERTSFPVDSGVNAIEKAQPFANAQISLRFGDLGKLKCACGDTCQCRYVPPFRPYPLSPYYYPFPQPHPYSQYFSSPQYPIFPYYPQTYAAPPYFANQEAVIEEMAKQNDKPQHASVIVSDNAKVNQVSIVQNDNVVNDGAQVVNKNDIDEAAQLIDNNIIKGEINNEQPTILSTVDLAEDIIAPAIPEVVAPVSTLDTLPPLLDTADQLTNPDSVAPLPVPNTLPALAYPNTLLPFPIPDTLPPLPIANTLPPCPCSDKPSCSCSDKVSPVTTPSVLPPISPIAPLLPQLLPIPSLAPFTDEVAVTNNGIIKLRPSLPNLKFIDVGLNQAPTVRENDICNLGESLQPYFGNGQTRPELLVTYPIFKKSPAGVLFPNYGLGRQVILPQVGPYRRGYAYSTGSGYYSDPIRTLLYKKPALFEVLGPQTPFIRRVKYVAAPAACNCGGGCPSCSSCARYAGELNEMGY